MSIENLRDRIGCPGNDNSVMAPRPEWAVRTLQEKMWIDTSVFDFKLGSTWSNIIQEHRRYSVELCDRGLVEGTPQEVTNRRPVYGEALPAPNDTDCYWSKRWSGGAAGRDVVLAGALIGLKCVFGSGQDQVWALDPAKNLNSGLPNQAAPKAANDASVHSWLVQTDPNAADDLQQGRNLANAYLPDAQQVSVTCIDCLPGSTDYPQAPAHFQDLPPIGPATGPSVGGADTAPGLANAKILPELTDASARRLQGSSGDDILTAGGWGDVLLGGAGNDVLIGGVGDDVLDGGEDADRMLGGNGDDTYIVDENLDAVIEYIDSGIDAVETTLSEYWLDANVENLIDIGDGNFIGHGNEGDNTIRAGDGDDHLYGDDARDHDRDNDEPSDTALQQEMASDELIETALISILGTEHDAFVFEDENTSVPALRETFVSGTRSNDHIVGARHGNDLIDGGRGNDVIDGGGGDDTLIGGSGHDTFVFRPGFGNDTIIDFGTEGGGRDMIWLSVGMFDSFEDLEGSIEQIGNDVVIAVSSTEHITLLNIQKINLSVHDHFEFV